MWKFTISIAFFSLQALKDLSTSPLIVNKRSDQVLAIAQFN